MAVIGGSQAGETLDGGAGDDIITAFAPDGAASTILATRIATDLAKPIAAAAPPDGSGRLFILERDGLLKVMDIATGAIAATPALDLRGQIAIDGERGLLGLTFHPDFATNGRFFVFLSQTNGTSEVREYRLGADGAAVPGSARTILEIPQPPGLSNHKAGWIGFGPDGNLYVAVGDGGGGGDQQNNAQNTESLLGKILRLDVDGDDFAADPLRNYAIPDGNPFVGGPGLDEIFAYGLRNPFRAGFDPATGRLFVGDVGQGAREEISIVAAGDNLGWRLYEGNAPYNPSSGAPTAGLTFPIHDYGRDIGQSVTGGLVYRGPSEALHGRYIFGDFISGRFFALEDTNGDGTWTSTEITALLAANLGTVGLPAAFATAPDGALLVVDYGGEVYRLDPVLAGPADGADLVRAGGGRDMVYAGGGADTVWGGTGSDTLQGMAGDDRLNGQDDADSLVGGAGTDLMFGGAGDDTLDGGAGNDVGWGGAGHDLHLVGGHGDIVVELAGGGDDTVLAAATYRLGAHVETLVLSAAAGAATGIGAATASRVVGNASANALFGLAADDTLEGGLGADRLNGGAGRDRLAGGGGTDMLIGGAGDDTLLVDSRADRVVEVAGGGTDTVVASGADGYWLPGGIEVLRLEGAARFGVGNAGNNTVIGSDGADRLYGQGGDDWIDGGAGNDTIWGGAGTDTFSFAPGAGNDVVVDFVDGEDFFVLGPGTSIVIEQVAAGTLITYGTGETMLLRGAVLTLPAPPGDGNITLRAGGLIPPGDLTGITLRATGDIGLSTGGTIGVGGGSLSASTTGGITLPGITLTGDTVL